MTFKNLFKFYKNTLHLFEHLNQIRLKSSENLQKNIVVVKIRKSA